jgi:hypothetical protein
MGGMAFNSMGRDGLENQPLYNGLTGYITNFRHGIGKVARNMAYAPAENGTEGYHPVPREIKVSFTFNVVHDKEVGWRKVGKDYHFSEEGYGTNFPYNLGDPGATDIAGMLVDDVLDPFGDQRGAEGFKPPTTATGDSKNLKNSKTSAKAEVEKCKVKTVEIKFAFTDDERRQKQMDQYGSGATNTGGDTFTAMVCKDTGKPAPQLVG